MNAISSTWTDNTDNTDTANNTTINNIDNNNIVTTCIHRNKLKNTASILSLNNNDSVWVGIYPTKEQ